MDSNLVQGHHGNMSLLTSSENANLLSYLTLHIAPKLNYSIEEYHICYLCHSEVLNITGLTAIIENEKLCGCNVTKLEVE